MVLNEACATGIVCPCFNTGSLNCIVDGMWTEWNEWGDCSATCGAGDAVRERYCINPPPTDGGAYCTGDSIETQSCNLGICSNPGKTTKVLSEGSHF